VVWGTVILFWYSLSGRELQIWLQVLTEILVKLDLGPFMVKINHRVLLDGMMQLCGVPGDKFRTICSAIDKLDKEPWEAVRAEMVHEKGLSPQVILDQVLILY